MPSARRRGLTLPSILAFLPLSIGGCAAIPQPAILAALRCSDLVPRTYRTDVQSVGPLREGATVGDLAVALDGQTMRLAQANGRTGDVVAMIDACDARSAEVLEALKPKKRFRWF